MSAGGDRDGGAASGAASQARGRRRCTSMRRWRARRWSRASRRCRRRWSRSSCSTCWSTSSDCTAPMAGSPDGGGPDGAPDHLPAGGPAAPARVGLHASAPRSTCSPPTSTWCRPCVAAGRAFHAARAARRCASASFHPMLLLPLVQRAVRSGRRSPPPPSTLAAHRHGRASLRLVLEPRHRPTCASSDAELLRLQERLQVLYEGRAQPALRGTAGPDPTTGEPAPAPAPASC